MTNPSPQQTVEQRTRRAMFQIIAAAVFFALLLVVSAIVIRPYIGGPAAIIILPPEIAQQARAAAAPQVARNIVQASPNGTGPTFKGDVFDAQTHQPIPTFTVRIGYKYQFNSNQAPYYNGGAKDFHGGKFTITPPFTIGTQGIWFVRIDAPGHLPSLSPGQKTSGQLDFQLQTGKDVTGIVRDASGAPAGGITVLMAGPGLEVNFDPTNLKNTNSSFQTTTGPDGTFTFPPQSDELILAAMNDAGFAQQAVNPDATAKIELRLAAWSSIQGRLTIAGKPGANQRIEAEGGTQAGPAAPSVYADSETNTDADGKFQFNRIVPAQMSVSRILVRKLGNRGTQRRNTQTEPVMAIAGKTMTVNIGGGGRPVIGKLIFPTGASINNYYINDNINGQVTPPPAELPPNMPDKVKQGTPMARDMWMGFFSLTAAGKQWTAAHPPPQPVWRQYAMEVSTDGKFRIEDVAPGDYQVYIFPSQMRTGPSLQQINMTFTVPPVPGGGYSDQPIVLPDITFMRQGQ